MREAELRDAGEVSISHLRTVIKGQSPGDACVVKEQGMLQYTSSCPAAELEGGGLSYYGSL